MHNPKAHLPYTPIPNLITRCDTKQCHHAVSGHITHTIHNTTTTCRCLLCIVSFSLWQLFTHPTRYVLRDFRPSDANTTHNTHNIYILCAISRTIAPKTPHRQVQSMSIMCAAGQWYYYIADFVRQHAFINPCRRRRPGFTIVHYSPTRLKYIYTDIPTASHIHFFPDSGLLGIARPLHNCPSTPSSRSNICLSLDHQTYLWRWPENHFCTIWRRRTRLKIHSAQPNRMQEISNLYKNHTKNSCY